jgi:Dinitrogenase iron-molybdenum cofactor
MRIRIPITCDEGLDSLISSHFGSAPLFAVVDSESGVVRRLTNARAVHEHGACSPPMPRPVAPRQPGPSIASISNGSPLTVQIMLGVPQPPTFRTDCRVE